MKKKKKLFFIFAGLCTLVLAACYTVFIAPLLEKEQWAYIESSVERGTLTVGVTESGALTYGTTSVVYDLDLDVSKDEEDDEEDEEETVQKYLEIESVYAVAGQRISAGDALIQFTDDSISDVRKLLEAALVEARAEYNEAEAEYSLSVLEAQTDYEAKTIAEKYAQSIYGSAKSEVNNSAAALRVQIEQCRANVASLEEKLADAQESYEDALEEYTGARESYELYKDTDNISNFTVYQSAYISAQTLYQNARSALEQAQQNLEKNADQIASLQIELTAQEGKTGIDALEAEQTYQEALISGKNAEITYDAKLASLKEELEEAEETRQELEKKLQDFEEFVGEDGVLYAEEEGIVTESNYKAGESLKQAGVLLVYAGPEDMTISVDVAQEDVVELSVGDKVEIEFTAYEGEKYSGTVLSIDTTATSENSNTVSYTVEIGVEGDTSMLYGGMVADVTFVTEQKENVLFVSKKALVTENGKSYVYTESAFGGRELTEVKTGISNSTSIEIVSGLEEGQRIYIASRVSSEEEINATGSTGSNSGETNFGGSVIGEYTLPDGMEFSGNVYSFDEAGGAGEGTQMLNRTAGGPGGRQGRE